MDSDANGWIEELPGELANHAEILRRAVAGAKSDPRMRALQIQGSVGRGTADRNSDLDLGLVVADTSWPAILHEIPDFVHFLGDVIDDYYQLGSSGQTPDIFRAWAQLADGVQLDLLVVPSSRQLNSGPDGRTLFDPDGLLVEADDPARLSEPAVVAKWAFLCWHALAKTAKFLERGQLVAAAEWMNPARQATISCWAAVHGADYAGYANVMAAQIGRTHPWLEGLDETYAKPVYESVLDAALKLAEIQARVDQVLLGRLSIPVRPLAEWTQEQLRALERRPGQAGGRLEPRSPLDTTPQESSPL